jgi:hypothetical protein
MPQKGVSLMSLMELQRWLIVIALLPLLAGMGIGMSGCSRGSDASRAAATTAPPVPVSSRAQQQMQQIEKSGLPAEAKAMEMGRAARQGQ